MKQITNTILMVRPAAFRSNEQTKVNNFFQEDLDLQLEEINDRAQNEFDTFVEKLKNVGVEVIVFQDEKENDTPDSIYPNNWISFHQSGNVALYPMFAENRRRERNEEVLQLIESKGYSIENIIDYSEAENDNLFLEGTGSLVLDRENRKAYCALSARADEELLIEFCEDFEYTPVIFTAYQTVKNQREIIYHTNILMCIGDKFCIICLDTIDDKTEKKNIVAHLKEDNKEIITITEEQMHHFAGNMLQVIGDKGKSYLVMSQSAKECLSEDQINTIERYTKILSSDLHTIETLGGGSARCMMAEVFLPKN